MSDMWVAYSTNEAKYAILSGDLLIDRNWCSIPHSTKVEEIKCSVHKEGNKMALTYTNSKGNTYILHRKVTTLKNGRQQAIHYFAREEKKDAEVLNEVPTGYIVSESKNGLPVLKKADKA